MTKYLVRVTRDLDDENVDVEVEAATWDEAKAKAVAEVAANPDYFFGEVPPPTYNVAAMDDDEEAAVME